MISSFYKNQESIISYRADIYTSYVVISQISGSDMDETWTEVAVLPVYNNVSGVQTLTWES